MELRDFTNRRWISLLVSVPILTGVLAVVALSAFSDRQHVAAATISIGDATSEALEPGLIGGRIDDFALALRGPTVANTVADATGLSVAEVRAGFRALRSGTGELVDVDFRHSDPEVVLDALETGVRSALVNLNEADLARAELRVRAARQQRDPAQRETREIEQRAGTSDLLVEYRSRSADILELRTTIAQSFGDPALTASLTTLLEEKKAELDALGVEIALWNEAQRRLENSNDELTRAERDLFVVEAARDRAANYDLGAVANVESESPLSSVALPTLAAMVGAFALVFLAAMSSNRERVRRPSER